MFTRRGHRNMAIGQGRNLIISKYCRELSSERFLFVVSEQGRDLCSTLTAPTSRQFCNITPPGGKRSFVFPDARTPRPPEIDSDD